MAKGWKKTVLAAVLAVGSAMGAMSGAQAGEDPGISGAPGADGDTYSCAMTLDNTDGEKADWLCKNNRTGGLVNEGSVGLNGAMSIVIKNEFNKMSLTKAEIGKVTASLTVDANADFVEYTSQGTYSSPSNSPAP